MRVLDVQTRGLIDTIIDNVVQNVGEIAKLCFAHPESNKQLHIQNESDFALGLGFGSIYAWCITSFVSMHARFPDEHEQSELAAVIVHDYYEWNNLTSYPVRHDHPHDAHKQFPISAKPKVCLSSIFENDNEEPLISEWFSGWIRDISDLQKEVNDAIGRLHDQLHNRMKN